MRHTFLEEIEDDRWILELNIVNFHQTSVTFENSSRELVAVAFKKEFNVFFKDNSSLMILCLGGPSVTQSNAILNLKNNPFSLYRRFDGINSNKQFFKYLGEFYAVSQTQERRTLGLISSLMPLMRTRGGKPYILEKAFILAKNILDWEIDLKHYFEQEFTIDYTLKSFEVDHETLKKRIFKN